MVNDFNLLIERLNHIEEDTFPKWGEMTSFKMIIHCNSFIEVSMGHHKIRGTTKLFGRLFGKLYLRYLESLNFDIKKYPKNSKTLREFKPVISRASFSSEKNKLEKNIHKVAQIKSQYTYHSIYGKIETTLFKKLVYFHTSYHFNQFGMTESLSNK
jgi:hypothetical protein